MRPEQLIVTIVGVGFIGFIYWFFFNKKEEQSISGTEANIKVDGGYNPSVIRIKKGSPVTLNLTRKDPNSCLEEFVLPDFKIKEYLPLGKKVSIKIEPKEAGEYPFHCGMNMFHGKVIVE